MIDELITRIFVESYLVTLKFKKPIKFHIYHGPKIYGFISRLAGFHPEKSYTQKVNDIVIFTPEWKRINYSANSLYNFQITFLNNRKNLIENFRKRIIKIPEDFQYGDLNYDSVELYDLNKINDYLNYNDYKDEILELFFLTPLRIERKKEDKKPGKTLFDLEYFDFNHFINLLYRRILYLYNLNANQNLIENLLKPLEYSIIEKKFLWVDAIESDDKHTLGGITGFLKLKIDLNDLAKKILWFGQICHAGKYTSAGFGKYLIEKTSHKKNLIKPALTFLDLVLDEKNLLSSYKYIRGVSNEIDFNEGKSINESEIIDRLKNISIKIKEKSYEPEELKCTILVKDKTKRRILTVPSIYDRILQRATIQVIGDTIDLLLEESSYAYRKGLSRKNAIKSIQEIINKGYKYVIRADIADFFDTMDWDILIKKLSILFYDDPLLELLIKWIKANAIYEGKIIKRYRGLPQGAVISPLLANFYLDELDEKIGENFKLIRYADDILILCKSIEEAKNSINKLNQELKKLNLKLSDSKTGIFSLRNGFQFLGYFINRNGAFANKKEKDGKKIRNEFYTKDESLKKILDSTWLINLNLDNYEYIKSKLEYKPKSLNKNEIQKIFSDKFPLYITGNSLINLNKDNLEIISRDVDGNEIKKFQPIKDISSLILIGYNRLTVNTLLRLQEYGVPIYFCKVTGELKYSLPVFKPYFNLWLNQLALSNSEVFKLNFSKLIVSAKVNNYKVMIRRLFNETNLIKSFNDIIKKIEIADSIEKLRGYEGTATAKFYEIFNKSLPEEWRFKSRTKRPPMDPLNSMLSLGYSIIYHHIATSIILEGLNPQIGFFHNPSNRYFPLASDLQEEFRHIIDSLVHYMISKKMVSREDFYYDWNKKGACLMKKEFFKKFISEVEDRLLINFKPDGFTNKISYRNFITYQVKILKDSILKNELLYKPLRIR